jgi:YkoY family integral membrane protein
MAIGLRANDPTAPVGTPAGAGCGRCDLMFQFSLSDVPLISWYIGVLVFLEGLLSADNALVLALMVRHLPKLEQRRVLRVGIWGAVLFRFVAVLLSAYLLKFWIFKVLGGGYLLYLAIKHFVSGEEDSGSGRGGWNRSFWGTVAAVTFADIAFSIDSILAAVGMAEDFPERFGENGKLFIVFVGGVLGIITMRFVVRYFVSLLDRFPGLAEGAYFLVAWIGLKLVISGCHAASPKYVPFHIPETLFWSVMVAIAVLSFLVKPRARSTAMSESFDMLESEEPSQENAGGPQHGAPKSEGVRNNGPRSDGTTPDHAPDNGAILPDHSDPIRADAGPDAPSAQTE